MHEQRIRSIEKWAKHKGKHDLLRHLNSERLTQREAIVAKCYECSGGYDDGAIFCELHHCPLSQYHPFKNKQSGDACTDLHSKSADTGKG